MPRAREDRGGPRPSAAESDARPRHVVVLQPEPREMDRARAASPMAATRYGADAVGRVAACRCPRTRARSGPRCSSIRKARACDADAARGNDRARVERAGHASRMTLALPGTECRHARRWHGDPLARTALVAGDRRARRRDAAAWRSTCRRAASRGRCAASEAGGRRQQALPAGPALVRVCAGDVRAERVRTGQCAPVSPCRKRRFHADGRAKLRSGCAAPARGVGGAIRVHDPAAAAVFGRLTTALQLQGNGLLLTGCSLPSA